MIKIIKYYIYYIVELLVRVSVDTDKKRSVFKVTGYESKQKAWGEAGGLLLFLITGLILMLNALFEVVQCNDIQRTLITMMVIAILPSIAITMCVEKAKFKSFRWQRYEATKNERRLASLITLVCVGFFVVGIFVNY